MRVSSDTLESLRVIITPLDTDERRSMSTTTHLPKSIEAAASEYGWTVKSADELLVALVKGGKYINVHLRWVSSQDSYEGTVRLHHADTATKHLHTVAAVVEEMSK